MLRADRTSLFFRLLKQTTLFLPLLILPLPLSLPVPLLNPILLRLDPQRLLRERLHIIIQQKPKNIHDIIVRLTIRHDPKPRPLAEPLRLLVREARLPALAVVQVLIPRHPPRALIALPQAQQTRRIHLLFFLVVVVFPLGQLLAEIAAHVPGQLHPLLSPLRHVQRHCGTPTRFPCAGSPERVVHPHVGGVPAALVVAVFRGLADVFPGEEGLQPGGLCFVVPDQEEEVCDCDGPGAAPGG